MDIYMTIFIINFILHSIRFRYIFTKFSKDFQIWITFMSYSWFASNSKTLPVRLPNICIYQTEFHSINGKKENVSIGHFSFKSEL